MAHHALVVGASGIVGSATSRLLAEQGWQVTGLARNPNTAENVTPLAADPVSYTHLTLPTTPYV